MTLPLQKINPRKPVSGKEYNMLVDRINSIRIQSTQNIKQIVTSHGTHLIAQSNSTPMKLWRVSTAQADHGYYNCREQGMAEAVTKYTSGGTNTIAAGNIITGATSEATAEVLTDGVHISTGTFGAGTAAGKLTLGSITGTFQTGENIDTVAQSNNATLDGLPEGFNVGGKHFIFYRTALTTVLNIMESGNEDDNALAAGDFLVGYYIGGNPIGWPAYTPARIARIDSNQTGMLGPYYNCILQTIDIENSWNTTDTGQTSNTSQDVQVMNLYEKEIGAGTRLMQTDDVMICWPTFGAVIDAVHVRGATVWWGIPINRLNLTGAGSRDVPGVATGTLAELQTVVQNLLTTLDNLRWIQDSTT
jgi:hypothetical protein